MGERRACAGTWAAGGAHHGERNWLEVGDGADRRAQCVSEREGGRGEGDWASSVGLTGLRGKERREGGVGWAERRSFPFFLDKHHLNKFVLNSNTI